MPGVDHRTVDGVEFLRLQRAYRDGVRRPYRARRAAEIVLDLQFADALHY
jgi:hypothetical protein